MTRSIFSSPAGCPDFFDPETNICWHIGSGWGRHRCHTNHRECKQDRFILADAVPARWFWVVNNFTAMLREEPGTWCQGWEDTEGLAENAVRAAIARLANGRSVVATLSHGSAYDRLKISTKSNDSSDRHRTPPIPSASNICTIGPTGIKSSRRRPSASITSNEESVSIGTVTPSSTNTYARAATG